MARFLIRGVVPLARVTVAATFLLAVGMTSARADDPTRPPSVSAAGEVTVEDSGPQLQSVFLPQGGTKTARPAALISGQRVEVGQRFGEWRLLAVTESTATLAGPAGRQVLSLTPGVAKSPRSSASAKAPHHRSTGRPAPASALPSTGTRQP